MLWHIEFMKTGFRWRESLQGKYKRSTIFDERPLLRRKAGNWLRSKVTAKNTQDNPNAVFRIKDFQDYLNQKDGFLHKYKIKRHELHRTDLYRVEEPNITWCTVSIKKSIEYYCID